MSNEPVGYYQPKHDPDYPPPDGKNPPHIRKLKTNKTVWIVMKSEHDGKGGTIDVPVKAFWDEADAEKFADDSTSYSPSDYFDDVPFYHVVEIAVE